jgi:hypothetical protein
MPRAVKPSFKTGFEDLSLEINHMETRISFDKKWLLISTLEITSL